MCIPKMPFEILLISEIQSLGSTDFVDRKTAEAQGAQWPVRAQPASGTTQMKRQAF